MKPPGGILLSICLACAAPAPGPAQEVAVTRGPYLQALLETSVEILWRTSVPGVGAVRCSAEDVPPFEAREAAAGEFHRVRLSGLSRGTLYAYEVLHDGAVLRSGEGQALRFRFRTSPGANQGTFRVAVVGDSGTGNASQQAIATVIKATAPDLFLHTGDIDYTYDVDRSVFGPYRDIFPEACFYPSMGNHDWSLPWGELFVPPSRSPDEEGTYYSFDWGSAHFAALNTTDDLEPGSEQLQWLIEDLEKAKGSGLRWTILYFHHPVITVGPYYRSRYAVRSVIPPIADHYKVDLVLTGHDHNFQMSHPVSNWVVRDAWQYPAFVSPRGTLYVVTGGGGGVLYPEVASADHRFSRTFLQEYHCLRIDISATEISLDVLGSGGARLDSFTLTKEGERPTLSFLRGDADFNRKLELGDAVVILEYLFLGGHLDCPGAARVEDAGSEPSLADAIYILSYLFLGGSPPSSPFPECGPAPAADDAWCLRAGCGD